MSDGKIDPEEIIEVVKQVENVVEYSSGFTQEVFRDHIATVVNRNPEFGNLLGRNPLEGLKVVADLLGRIEHSEAQSFKKILLKIAIEVAKSSSGIDENEEKAILVVRGILDGII